MAGEAPPLVVLDASVAAKWFVSDGEDGVSDAHALLSAHSAGEIRLVAPALIAYELLGVVARGRREAPNVRGAIEAFYDTGVALVAPDLDMMLVAADLVTERRIHALDSAYAALAMTLDCELATADRRLARALEGTVAIRAV